MTELEKIVVINIEDIQFDENIYPRTQYSWHVAWTYSQLMKSGNIFPPIRLGLYKEKYYVIDGKHRIEANKVLGRKQIQAYVKKYNSKKEMIIDAWNLNKTHGKQLTWFDRTQAYIRFTKLGVSEKTQRLLLGVPDLNIFKEYIIQGKDGKPKIVGRKTRFSLKRNVIAEEDVAQQYNEHEENMFGSGSVNNAMDEMLYVLHRQLIPFHVPEAKGKATEIYTLLKEQLELAED